MNNRLEQFVRDHREEFDSDEPDMKIWDKIQLDLDPPATESRETGSAPVFPIRRTWMSVAAAVIVLLAGGLWLLTGRHTGAINDPNTGITAGTTPKTESAESAQPATQPANQPADHPAQSPTEIAAAPKTSPKKEKSEHAAADEEKTMDEEMYHYARLVELKHKQLKSIEKDEPMLYRQFAADVDKLENVYHGLERELPSNPNREQLLEAMLQNLQLQMQLLTHQLDIIKQINHSKQKAYEKAYKTI